MIPNNVLGVAIFVLCIAPGTCYELLRGRTRLPREESTFQQISRILLSGLVITALTILTMTIIWACSPGSLVDVAKLISSGADYLSANVGLTGWTLILFLAISILYAVVLNGLLTADEAPAIEPADAWHTLAEVIPRKHLEGRHQVTASLRLKSGRDVVGVYVGASTELDSSKREIMLQGPIHVREKGKHESTLLDEQWAFASFVGSEIESITFAYSPMEDGADTENLSSGSSSAKACIAWFRRHYLDWRLAGATIIIITMTAIAAKTRWPLIWIPWISSL